MDGNIRIEQDVCRLQVNLHMYMHTLNFAPVIVPPLESEANSLMWERTVLEKSFR